MIKSERIPAAGADGKIAFTYDRLNAEVKSLRVTSDLPDLPTEKPLAENGYDTDVYEPVTDPVMAPTVVAENSGESAAAVAAGGRAGLGLGGVGRRAGPGGFLRGCRCRFRLRASLPSSSSRAREMLLVALPKTVTVGNVEKS